VMMMTPAGLALCGLLPDKRHLDDVGLYFVFRPG
jgi:hypothetical protein